jgi:hypothetical protein
MSTHHPVLDAPPIAPSDTVAAPLVVRARARVHRSRLVRELAAGADPDGTPERALCAAHLTTMRTRRGLAASVVNIIDAVSEPARGLSSAAPLARREILAARPALVGLNRRLCAPLTVNPRGVAILYELLRDAASPLYFPSDPDALDAAVGEATLALGAPRGA